MTGNHIAGNVDTYITPAAWFYGIWHILNVLLLGLIVYQFWPGTAQLTQYSLGWRFPTALVLHALCTLLYAQKNSTPIYYVAFITFCMVTTLVNQLYGNLRTDAEPLNWADVFFVFLPISLYHGATIILFFVSVFAISGFHSRARGRNCHQGTCIFNSVFPRQYSDGLCVLRQWRHWRCYCYYDWLACDRPTPANLRICSLVGFVRIFIYANYITECFL